MVDEQQMSFFEEGGMSAPEAEADPASGNEVPPGSLPEEVRDDVDAKLSTGEYVVSADVLRYYGMKFFEDLRKQAKESLAEMDSEGRIGGEPMTDQEGTPELQSSDLGEGLSAQEMALLQEIMSEGGGEPQFNQGGTVLKNPEFYPKVGMAEGGMTTRSSFNPDSWRTIGSSFSSPQSASTGAGVGSYYKTYVGPNGETRLILFVNGEPTTPIPEGFTEQKSGASEVQEEQAKEEVAQRDDSDADQRRQEDREGEQQRDTRDWAEKNFDALSTDPVAFGLEALGANELVGRAGAGAGAFGGVLGLVGGGVARAMQVQNLAQAKAAQEIAKASGVDTSKLDKEIEAQDKKLGFIDDIAERFNIGTGSRYTQAYKDLVESRTVPQTEAVFSTTRATDNRTPDQAADRAREIATQYGGDGDSNEVRTEQARTTEGTVSTIGGTGEGNAGVSVRSGSAAPTESSRPQGRPDRPEMNKGGLVKRRKKKTTKT